jgi:hypothetical protein
LTANEINIKCYCFLFHIKLNLENIYPLISMLL